MRRSRSKAESPASLFLRRDLEKAEHGPAFGRGKRAEWSVHRIGITLIACRHAFRLPEIDVAAIGIGGIDHDISRGCVGKDNRASRRIMSGDDALALVQSHGGSQFVYG
jgi:hypothetical protein